MPTDKPRVTFTISKEKLAELESFQHENKIKNQTHAVLALIEKGLTGYDSEEKKSPSTAEAASGDTLRSTLLHNFDQLNQEGREKLVGLSDDLVSTGKYIKSGQNRMDKTQGA